MWKSHTSTFLLSDCHWISFPFFIMFPISCFKCISLVYSASSHLLAISMFYRGSPHVSFNHYFSSFSSNVCLFILFLCSCISSLVPSLFCPFNLFSSLPFASWLQQCTSPASVSLIRMAVTVWGKWLRVCVTRAQWLSELTAHKRGSNPMR